MPKVKVDVPLRYVNGQPKYRGQSVDFTLTEWNALGPEGQKGLIIQDNTDILEAKVDEAVTSAGAGGGVADQDIVDIAEIDSTSAGILVTEGAGWLRKTFAEVKGLLSLTKGDVGLSNVNNTSDANKPISTATQEALDTLGATVAGIGNSLTGTQTTVATHGATLVSQGETLTTVQEDLGNLQTQVDGLPSGPTGVSAPDKPAVSLAPLATRLQAEWGFNAIASIQDNVTTDGDVQYAVFWDTLRHATIAKRTLPRTDWSQIVDLSTIAGYNFGQVAMDNHNSLSVCVTSDGRIHVVGNVHNNPLTGMRSNAAGDITAWTALDYAPGVVDVSYPMFLRLPNGDTILTYRSGGAGNGFQRIAKYNPVTKVFDDMGIWCSGTPSGESPYFNHLSVDPDTGIIHTFFTWRSIGTPDTTKDLCYAQSADGGVTWRKSDGTAYALPITHATAELVVDTADNGSGLLNTTGADVDADGRPHTAYWLYDANGKTQIFHAYRDVDGWHTRQVTFDLTQRIVLTDAAGIVDYRLSRPSVVCAADGSTYVIYRANTDGRNGSVRGIDITPGRTIFEFALTLDVPLGEWEPTYDTRAAKERDELHMLFVPCMAYGAGSTAYVASNDWVEQWGAVGSYDLSQMRDIAARSTRLPTIKLLGTSTGKDGGTTIASATTADTGCPALAITETEIGILMARYSWRGKVDVGTTEMTVQISESRDTLNGVLNFVNRLMGNQKTSSTTTVVKSTYWQPLRYLGQPGAAGFVIGRMVRTAGTGTGSHNFGRMELGVLGLV